MLFLVKLVVPKQANVGISLVIAFIIDTFKGVEARFTLFGFETRRIHLEICFATLSELVMVFGLMQTIIFDILRFLEITCKCCVAPLPTIFALGDARVHVCSLNSSNKTPYIEALIDNFLD